MDYLSNLNWLKNQFIFHYTLGSGIQRKKPNWYFNIGLYMVSTNNSMLIADQHVTFLQYMSYKALYLG